MGEPLTILHGVGTAVSAAFTVTNTLIQIGQAIVGVDRTLQQIQQEVSDLQETLERMGQDFSGPVGVQLLQSNTGSLGNHWRAVLKIIERANRTLSEMEACLRQVPYDDGGNMTKPLRATWLSFKNYDIAYYRSEIQILTRNMHFELTMVLVCRDMHGMSNPGAKGFQVDLIATEDRWKELRSEAANLQSSSTSTRSASTTRRKPVNNSSTTTLVPDESAIGSEYLRQQQLATAKEVQEDLSTASELLSSASTVCAEPYRRSFGEDIEQSADKQAAIMRYVEHQQYHQDHDDLPQARDKPTEIWLEGLLFLPRCVGSVGMFLVQLTTYSFMLAYFCLWILALPFMGFRNCSGQFRRLTTDFGRVNNWFTKSWHNMLGC